MKEPLTPGNRPAAHTTWFSGFAAPSRRNLPPRAHLVARLARLWANLGIVALVIAVLLAGRSVILLGGAPGLDPASRTSNQYLAADLLGLALILAALGAPLLLAAYKARLGEADELALQSLGLLKKHPLPPHANSAHLVAPSLPHRHIPPRQPSRRAY